MTSRGTPFKYLRCDNAGEHKSALKKLCKKEKIILEYTTPRKPRFNVIIEIISAVIK